MICAVGFTREDRSGSNASSGSKVGYPLVETCPCASQLVVAPVLDLASALLDDLRRPNIEVRSLDVMSEELPSGFDLVHFRLLVGHLPDPDEGLRCIHAAVRPGGWLLAEEADSLWAFVDGAPAWPA